MGKWESDSKTFLSKLFIPRKIIQSAEKKSDHCFTLYGHYFNWNYIKHFNNCYQLVTCEWYAKFPQVWRTISTSKTKLSETYVLYSYMILSVTVAMLNTLIKPNDNYREPHNRNILVFLHSQGIVSKVTLKLQPTWSYAFFICWFFNSQKQSPRGVL